MKKESILFTLTLSFLLSLFIVVISFIILINHNQQEHTHHLKKRFMPVAKMMLEQHKRSGFNQNFFSSLHELEFEYVQKYNDIRAILYNPKTKVVLQREFRNILIRVLQLQGTYYLYIKQESQTGLKNLEWMLLDTQMQVVNTNIYLWVIFSIIVTALMLAYLTIYKKLYPLKILKQRVMHLANENFDFKITHNNGNDEVSLLAKEFEKTAQRLKQIKESRNVFIRNIMHELKTPITKGKILTQLPHDTNNDAKMQEVFDRLERLINEFGSIEELIASSQNIQKSYYFLNDIVDNAVDILLIDGQEVHKEFENLKLHVHFRLFSVAVKNLIDNALKYSLNKQVTIKTAMVNGRWQIIFQNEAEPLKYPLENYFEPFFYTQNKQSFGLGLYIVNAILSANGYELHYEYNNHINYFIIEQKG
jgi:two-component system OmpR family sensor kinase